MADHEAAALHLLDVAAPAPPPSCEEPCASLAELAATALHAPVGVLSVLDGDGNWLVAAYGAQASELVGHDAACALVLNSETLLEIGRVDRDERLRDVTFAIGDRPVQFFAATRVVDAAGRAFGVLAVLDHVARKLDRAGRRTLELLGRQAEATLARVDSSRSMSDRETVELREFVDVVCHDLRAPIVNVLGFADQLQRDTQELRASVAAHRQTCPAALGRSLQEVLDEHVAPSLSHIRGSASQMHEQVKSLLELSRAERRTLNITEVDLGRILRDIVTSHEFELKHAGAHVVITVDARIETDPSMLHHVLENLIDNAVKYRSERRPLVIDVSVDLGERGVVLHVADTGRGIAAEHQAEIFKMFSRVGDKSSQGAGFGLCHARALARRIGGDIWCESAPDAGSIFHVALPWRLTPSATHGETDPSSSETARRPSSPAAARA